VLFQKPNIPIIVWFTAVVAGYFIKDGTLAELIDLVGFGTLFTWAWIELFKGVNYFRRLLGLTVLVLSLFLRV
jgi:hypothetical protein